MKKLIIILLLVPIFLMGQDFLTVPIYANSKYIEVDGVNEYIKTAAYSTEYGTSVSYSFWFNSHSEVTSYNGLVGEYVYANSGMRCFLYNNVAPKRIYTQWFTTTGTTSRYLFEDSLDDGNWHFVVVYCSPDSTGGYYDGVLSPTYAGHSWVETSNCILMIGQTQWYLNGDIDEVAIFSGVLTKEEMDYLYNRGTPQTCGDAREIDGLKNYFTMQDTVGTTVPNKAPNGGIAGDAIMVNMEAEDIKTYDNIILDYNFLTDSDGNFIIK